MKLISTNIFRFSRDTIKRPSKEKSDDNPSCKTRYTWLFQNFKKVNEPV